MTTCIFTKENYIHKSFGLNENPLTRVKIQLHAKISLSVPKVTLQITVYIDQLHKLNGPILHFNQDEYFFICLKKHWQFRFVWFLSKYCHNRFTFTKCKFFTPVQKVLQYHSTLFILNVQVKGCNMHWYSSAVFFCLECFYIPLHKKNMLFLHNFSLIQFTLKYIYVYFSYIKIIVECQSYFQSGMIWCLHLQDEKETKH